jgi:TetR/AcrR family transcriptional regulator
LTEFQRARRPEQKTARRDAILAAATELFDAEGPEGAGLNAIAARAGFTKSNVYRYFESREAVLLSLFVAEATAATTAIEARLGELHGADRPAIANALAAALLVRPRFCRLMSILSDTLELNVSEPAVIALKRDMLAMTTRLATALHAAIPAISAEGCGWVWTMVGLVLAGLWPASHPNPTVARVLAMEEFAAACLVAERDLERILLIILRGVA